MRQPQVVLALGVVVLAMGVVCTDPDVERVVRMKTTRQLRSILKDLEIDIPAGKEADKETLRDLAIKHDAIARWEAFYPEKKKPPPAEDPTSRWAEEHKHGYPPSVDAASLMSQLWPMLDKDEDGKITKQELSWLQGRRRLLLVPFVY